MPLPNIGPGELILILIIALVILGPGRLPDVASSLGKSLREFRRAASDVSDAGRIDPTPTPPANPASAVSQAPPTDGAATTPAPPAQAPTIPAPTEATRRSVDAPAPPAGDPARDSNAT